MTAAASLVCAVVSAVREKLAFSVVLEVCYDAKFFFSVILFLPLSFLLLLFWLLFFDNSSIFSLSDASILFQFLIRGV